VFKLSFDSRPHDTSTACVDPSVEGTEREPGQGKDQDPSREQPVIAVVSHPPYPPPAQWHCDNDLGDRTGVSARQQQFDEKPAHLMLSDFVIAVELRRVDLTGDQAIGEVPQSFNRCGIGLQLATNTVLDAAIGLSL
jgi:hypothetical protein